MSETRYPNETAAYRKARSALLAEEKALVARVKEVAAQRRNLPLGGKLKEDYVFVGANDSNLGQEVCFSELFGDKQTLLLYSYMFGPNWDKPCLSCTSLIDGFDRAVLSVNEHAAMSVVAKAAALKLNKWATGRGWSNISLVSAEKTEYLRDYNCQDDESDATLKPIMNVFTKRDGAIHHFWGSELPANHVDMVWAYWNLMDMTPEGRPDLPVAPLPFRSRFLEEHYLNRKWG